MRVSFLIPLFNCLPLTQAMLASLQATLPAGLDHEIILIDDGSTDGTRAWLQTLNTTPGSSLRVVLNDRNLGYAATNNRAAASATGDFLVLLNNDLVLTPRWLEPMLAAHATLGSRAGIIGNVQRSVATGAIDHTGIVIDEKGKPVHDRHLPRFAHPLKIVPAVTGACLLIKRDPWQSLGGFDTAFVNGGEDVDLCLRLRRRGLTVAVAQHSLILHHVSASAGRKARDEQNSRLLALRWRPDLSILACRNWSRAHLRRIASEPGSAPPSLHDVIAAIQVIPHALGLTRRPPFVAVRSVSDAFDTEVARWQALLD